MDNEIKKELYLSKGVKEYWIVKLLRLILIIKKLFSPLKTK